MAKSAGLVNLHYHPHEVFAYTISGKSAWALAASTH
jgi:2,4'-dihydroxyacetophenone dioxygenase